TDVRAKLLEAVVVARDRAGANVGAGTDRAVAQIGEVIGFDAGLEARVLHLDEIADMHIAAEVGAGTQARKGTDARTVADRRTDHVAERRDLHPLADGDARAEDDEGANHAVAADPRIGAEVDGGGI